ncbi:MAG: hypothetical protein QM664_11385 [Flavihumibacter sp.]
MRKRAWIMLSVLAAVCAAAGFFLFHTSYDEKKVAAGADQVLVIDIHRIRNTLLWEYLQTPARWHISWPARSKDSSFSDLVKLPDYAFLFHPKDQPLNAWYAVFDLKKPGIAPLQLKALGFEVSGTIYHSEKLGIDCLLAGNQLIAGNGRLNDKTLLQQTAVALLKEKKHLSHEAVETYLDQPAHLQWTAAATPWFEQAGGTAQFDKTSISASVYIQTRDSIGSRPQSFDLPAHALASLSWVQPAGALTQCLDTATKATISRWINFSVDSLLGANISRYHFYLPSFQSRIDSAITYEYDDAFNPIEKKTANAVTEPAFQLQLTGAGVDRIYQYWRANGNIGSDNIFSPSPFVAAEAALADSENLTVSSIHFKPMPTSPSSPALLLAQLRPPLLPDSLYKYLPGPLASALQQCSTITITLEKKTAHTLQLGLHADRRQP